MTEHKLKSCPFCSGRIFIVSNRDWHKLYGDHDDRCIFDADEPVITVPASDDQLLILIEDWNRRTLEPVIYESLQIVYHNTIPEFYSTIKFLYLNNIKFKAYTDILEIHL